MAAESAAELLLRNWREGTKIEALPAGMRPADRREGYKAASALAELSGDLVTGWKIAATSEAGQKHINVDGPLIGRIFGQRLLPAEASVPLTGNIMRVAEIEFAFRFGADLPPRREPYSQHEAMAAVSALHLSVEIPDSRFEDFTKVGAPSLIADTACACWLVLSPPVATPWRHLDLAGHAVRGLKNGALHAEGTGRAALGDPRAALTWFVNEAATYCGGVRASQFVTTGTCIVPMAIAAGDQIIADYGVLGRLQLSII